MTPPLESTTTCPAARSRTRRVPRASGRALAAAALVVLLVAVAGLGAPGVGAIRQAAGTPFPAPIVAPVDSGADVADEVDIAGIYRVGNDDPANPVIGVAFSTAFATPESDYRVSVLVGDPAGARIRASFVAGAAAGSVERSSDGETWEPVGDTSASLNSTTGVYEIAVPVGDQPDGASVWAEAQSGDTTETSPVFSLDALLGRAIEGGLPSGSLGEVTDSAGDPTGETIQLGAGPSLAIVNQGMTVTYPEAAPTELAGVPVTSVVDSVQLAPNFDAFGLTVDTVQIDRTAQSVSLVNGLSDPPGPVSSDTSTWFLGGFPASGVGALTFDLGEIANVLGFQLVPDTVGAGIVRSVVLEDGRTVTSTPVLATLDWYGATAGETQATTTTTEAAEGSSSDDDEDTQRQLLTIGAAVVAAVLAIAGIALIASARRKRHGHRILGEHADDRGVVDWTSEMEAVRIDEPTPAAPAAAPEPSKGKGRRRARSERAAEAAPVAESSGPPQPEVPPEVPPEAPPAPSPPDPPAATGGPALPDPLAGLVSEIGELSSRLERLGDDGDDRPA